jgi:predicted dehydrogenase
VRVQGQVANLKWTRPRYSAELTQRYGAEVDFVRRPVEDFARGTIELEVPGGGTAIIEATTSWAYVGAGLRFDLELMGPEYSMQASSLNSGLKVFFSRAISGESGEDLVEKQNAEQGLMPVVEDEAGAYGYTGENRHMTDCFRNGTVPRETFADGVAVVELIMALYKSAEEGRSLALPDAGLETYIPVAMRD